MADWVRLSKGNYINLANVIRTERGPAGNGIKLTFVDGTSHTYTDTDAGTIIAHLEIRAEKY